MGCSGSKNDSTAGATSGRAPEGDFQLTLAGTDWALLGATIVANVEPVGILVQSVQEEVLSPTGPKVKTGDLIVAVNAVFGDYEKMRKALEQQTISITVQRPVAADPKQGTTKTEPATAEVAGEQGTTNATEPAEEPTPGDGQPSSMDEMEAAAAAARQEARKPSGPTDAEVMSRYLCWIGGSAALTQRVRRTPADMLHQKTLADKLEGAGGLDDMQVSVVMAAADEGIQPIVVEELTLEKEEKEQGCCF
eukprot:TRINITY_DN7002_c0_g1_i1.p1 TRINITY_DN7002_c0_g1~~TRINITY_DN7002_c0_g1_i1.p1  ORF type:complete len:250 (-),score=55.03 TRINITY_DN7002_c0_g1_i1:288-1037(-)